MSERPPGSLISYMSNLVKKHGGINLAQGIPGFQPPTELITALRNTLDKDIHQYAPGTGDHLLIECLLEIYSDEATIDQDNILIVQGATEAISLVYIYLTQQLANPFSVLGFDPVYESYDHLPEIFSHNFVLFPLGADGTADMDTLESEIYLHNVQIIILSSPGNPWGKLWSRSELISLLDLARKNKIYIVLDAVYRQLFFNAPPSFPLDPLEKNLFYVNSFSKQLSITGWRIGYLICHSQNMSKIRAIHDYIGLCAPSLLQRAIAVYLKENEFGSRYTSEIRKRLKTNYNYMVPELEKLGFVVPESGGGYFIWTKIPRNLSSGYDFTMELYKKEKVAVIPGIHFSRNGNDFIRINIARELEEIRLAVSKTNQLLKTMS